VRTKFYQNRLAFVEDITKKFGVFLLVHSVDDVFCPKKMKSRVSCPFYNDFGVLN